MNIEITRATPEDSRDIWTWRNDEQTRAMSITKDYITWEDHEGWYNRSLTNPDRFLYIGRLDDKPFGMCRFDVDKDVAEAAINLKPEMRGKKLSVPFFASAILDFQALRGVPLAATIKKENVASIKCFTKCGFVFRRDDDAYNYYLRPEKT